MKKKIDWDEVDAEAEKYLKMCTAVDEQIVAERKKDKSLSEQSEEVDRFAKEHGLNVVYLEKED